MKFKYVTVHKKDNTEKATRNHYKQASKYTQDQLLDVVTKIPVNPPIMVTNYNPGNANIKKTLSTGTGIS